MNGLWAPIVARSKRPFNFAVEYFKAKQTGAVPFWLTRSIQRGLQRYQYHGIRMNKHPMDIALYSKLIWELKPKTIIEIGSAEGGSALWFADQFDGHVYSIDLKPPSLKDSRITFLQGDAESLTHNTDWPHPWLISEDSSHLAKTSKAVLNFFAPKMGVGDYIVIEDGNVTDIGNAHRRGGGPLAAVHAFLDEHPEFRIDRTYCDWYGHNVTSCVDGFLKKISC